MKVEKHQFVVLFHGDTAASATLANALLESVLTRCLILPLL